MDSKTLAKTGLTLLEEAVLCCMFHSSESHRTKRDLLLTELCIPFELGHEVLRQLEAAGRVTRDSEASYWRLSGQEHEARLPKMREAGFRSS